MNEAGEPAGLPLRLGFALFVACLAGFALLGRGRLESIDETLIDRQTDRLVDRATGQVPTDGAAPATRFGFLPALWAVPFRAVTRLLVSGDSGDANATAAWTIYGTQLAGAVATALAAWLLADWLSRLGFGHGLAVGCSLLYAFGTLALPYATTSYVQTVVTPLVVGLLRAVSLRAGVTAAIWAGLLVCCRPHFAVLALPLAVGVLGDATGPRRLARLLLLAAGMAVGLAANFTYQWANDATPWSGGYAGESFTTPWAVGVFGLLASSGKGLLWLSPLAAGGLVGLFGFAARRPWPGRMLLLAATAYWWLVAQWWTWHGGVNLGPRLLLPILPLSLLPIADWLRNSATWPAWQRRGLLVLVVASVGLAGYQAVQPINAYAETISRLGIHESDSVYIPHLGPLGTPFQGELPLPWRRALAGGPGASVLVAGLLVLLGLAVAFLGGRFGSSASLRWREAELRLGRFAGLLTLLAVGWALPHADALWQVPPMGWSAQVRHLEPRAGQTEVWGSLLAPVAGIYSFESADPRARLWLSGQWHPVGQQVVVIELQEAGDHPIGFASSTPHESPVYWTVPGAAWYRQPIPSWALRGETPTTWEHIVLAFRRARWVFWIVWALLAVSWAMAPPGKARPTTETDRGRANR